MFILVLIKEILVDIYKFLKYWFYYSLKYIFNKYFDNILAIERKFSIKLNISNFFVPLYGDRSLPAYVYAIPWRLVLILFGLILQILLFIGFILISLIWIISPVILSYLIYKNG